MNLVQCTWPRVVITKNVPAELDEDEMLMRAIAMSLEGGEEVEEKDRKGSREELLSIKGELLMTQNVRGCPFKCSDGAC